MFLCQFAEIEAYYPSPCHIQIIEPFYRLLLILDLNDCSLYSAFKCLIAKWTNVGKSIMPKNTCVVSHSSKAYLVNYSLELHLR